MSDTKGSAVEERATIRRAPKVPVFLVLGALLGFVVTLILVSAFPSDPTIGFPATFGYFLLYGIPAGVVVGGVVAIVLDRVASRRARTVTVERVTADDEEPS